MRTSRLAAAIVGVAAVAGLAVAAGPAAASPSPVVGHVYVNDNSGRQRTASPASIGMPTGV